MIRESASAGVIWKCWSNISFRLDSAILLSASRRLPLYPNHSRALQGRMEAAAAELLVNEGETADRGLKRPIEDLQTRCCHPLFSYLTSPHLSLCNLLFPSNLPQRPPTSWLVLLLPRPPPMSLDCWIQQDDELPGKTERNAKLPKIRGLKCRLAATFLPFEAHFSFREPFLFSLSLICFVVLEKKI